MIGTSIEVSQMKVFGILPVVIIETSFLFSSSRLTKLYQKQWTKLLKYLVVLKQVRELEMGVLEGITVKMFVLRYCRKYVYIQLMPLLPT